MKKLFALLLTLLVLATNASAAITYVDSCTGTTTCTLPAHQVGDLIIAFAFRDGNNTAPTIPGTFTTIESAAGSNSNGAASAYMIADSTSETSGTWTNATSLVIAVYRGVNQQVPIGGKANNGGSTNSINYPALTMTHTDGSSWVLGFIGHRSVDTDINTAPTAMSNRCPNGCVVDGTDEAALHDTAAGVSSWSSTNQTLSGTASGWRTHVIEIIAAPTWTSKGFNFRSTAGYVTDDASETYVLAETSWTVRRGATFMLSACADCKRDRDSGIDRRLAGFNGKLNDGTQATWTTILPQTGNYTVCIAGGDYTGDQIYQRFDVYDDTNLEFTVLDTNGTTAGNYVDTLAANYSAATFFANWDCQTGVAFGSTTLNIKLGATSSQTNQSTLSHVYLELEGGGGSDNLPLLQGLGEE